MTPRSILISFCAACALGVTAQEAAVPSPLSTPVERFEETGTFEQVLRQLAIRLRPDAVIGFVKTNGLEPRVSVRVDHVLVGEILAMMCSQDTRYKAVDSHTPHVINVVPATADTQQLLMGLLSLHVDHFDVSTEDWPENVFRRLSEFSLQVREYLTARYAELRASKEPLGSPMIKMNTNVPPPHIEIHLRDKSVMEVLDAISEWILARGSANDLSLPPGSKLWPQGWKCRTPSSDLPFDAWSSSICGAFP
jgi:hypothetical protein